MSLQFLRDRSTHVLDRLKVAELGRVSADLQAWLETDFGRYLRHQERRLLTEKYGQLPGYRLMHAGLSPDPQALDCFSHIHRFSFNTVPHAEASAVSHYAQLPLPSDTIDVALLQHAVEFSVSPKAVLAEVSRVVAPGGHLLLCLFNPYGPLGMIKFPMQLFSTEPQYGFHNLRKGRVIDWLSLLNFQVLEIDYGAYNLPINRPQWIEKDSGWERLARRIRFPFGNFYMIHAVKRVVRGISSGPSWRPAARGNPILGSKKRLTQIRDNTDKNPHR